MVSGSNLKVPNSKGTKTSSLNIIPDAKSEAMGVKGCISGIDEHNVAEFAWDVGHLRSQGGRAKRLKTALPASTGFFLLVIVGVVLTVIIRRPNEE